MPDPEPTEDQRRLSRALTEAIVAELDALKARVACMEMDAERAQEAPAAD